MVLPKWKGSFRSAWSFVCGQPLLQAYKHSPQYTYADIRPPDIIWQNHINRIRNRIIVILECLHCQNPSGYLFCAEFLRLELVVEDLLALLGRCLLSVFTLSSCLPVPWFCTWSDKQLMPWGVGGGWSWPGCLGEGGARITLREGIADVWFGRRQGVSRMRLCERRKRRSGDQPSDPTESQF